MAGKDLKKSISVSSDGSTSENKIIKNVEKEVNNQSNDLDQI